MGIGLLMSLQACRPRWGVFTNLGKYFSLFVSHGKGERCPIIRKEGKGPIIVEV
jgi:hypothetical protein